MFEKPCFSSIILLIVSKQHKGDSMFINLAYWLDAARRLGRLAGRSNRGIRRVGVQARAFGGIIYRQNFPAPIGLGPNSPRTSVVYFFANAYNGRAFVLWLLANV
jgi:hypothetical protein